MAADIKQARYEALREQTLIIEDITAVIKELLNKSLFAGIGFIAVVSDADKLIDNRVKEIGDEPLREDARRILKSYARKQYGKMLSIIAMGVAAVGFSLAAMRAVRQIWNSETAIGKAQAFERLKNIEPQFAGEQITFAPGAGAAWRWGVPLNTYMRDYMREVRKISDTLAKDNPQDADGLSLRLKAELYLRQQWQEQKLAELKESGVTYAWISTHENCSERCQPYQGKLYSLNHTSGVIDGHSYVPLEVATDRYYTTKAGKTYKNGTLTGFGCRHYLIPYKQGNEKPLQFSDARIERAREIEQKQRALERKVINLRQAYITNRGNDNIRARYYREKAAEAREQYVDFCKQNKIAWYPSRIQIPR